MNKVDKQVLQLCLADFYSIHHRCIHYNHFSKLANYEYHCVYQNDVFHSSLFASPFSEFCKSGHLGASEVNKAGTVLLKYLSINNSAGLQTHLSGDVR